MKIPSVKNVGSNNILFLVGGAAVAFAVYTFVTQGKGGLFPKAAPKAAGKKAVAVMPSASSISGSVDGYGGKYAYNPSNAKNYYPRVSTFMARAYATETPEQQLTSLKNKVLQNIINAAESVTTVLSNLETIKAEIETYTSKLQLAITEKTAGRITQGQIDAYLGEITKAIAEKLQITLKTNQFPGTTSTNPFEVPQYYKDYYQQYMDYMKQLMERYYQYYQPSYQYYPGQQYNTYQPYQYQYPYPYYPSNQYGGQSSYGFAQGYNPYAYGYGGGYGGNQMYGQQGTQGYGYGQSQYNFY